MKTFAEFKQDVAFVNSSGVGMIHAGRIAVLQGSPCPLRRSVAVVAIGHQGSPVWLRVPLEAVSVLGSYEPADQAPDRLYVGEYSGGDCRVSVFTLDGGGDVVAEPYALANPHRHASCYAWGYDGDGPADLALGLLRDAVTALDTDCDARSAIVEAHYIEFMRVFVQIQPERGRWSTTGSDLLRRLDAIIRDHAIA